MNDFTVAADAQSTDKALLKANDLSAESFRHKLAMLTDRFQQSLDYTFHPTAITVDGESPSAVAGRSNFGVWLLFLRTSAQGYADAYVAAKQAGLHTEAMGVGSAVYEALSDLPVEYADLMWKRITEIGIEALTPSNAPHPRTAGNLVAAALKEGDDMDPNPMGNVGAGADPVIFWADGYKGYIQVTEMSLADSGNVAMQDILLGRFQAIGDDTAIGSLLSRWGRASIVEDDTVSDLVGIAPALAAALFFTQ